MSHKRLHAIVNPASGQEEPILAVLNSVFREAGYEWDMTLTQAGRDTGALAREIAASGIDVLAVYGGDDTITAAATGLIDLNVPLAILPGGTANILAQELGIPLNLQRAAEIAIGGHPHCIDLGRAGDRFFSVRVSTGLLASMVIGVQPDLKARFGELAYALRGLEAALGESQNSHYTLVVDGQTFETEGVACFIANSGNLSLPGVSFAASTRVDDGLLDALVIRRIDVPSLVSLAASAARLGGAGEELLHWQGKRITVTAEPPHLAAIDGEELGQTPVTAEVVPSAVAVILPPDPTSGASL